ncbi:hypothetical protein [Shewanella surugensis]|uniref:Uncharacterized protein n=1 Tax=Shewanella surugensis TaxID=212020 RepID=A0ABT0LAG7_9GAMM|nr:hypothetical protein [Shewanella surugensis]MCL1124554.1 hypothetical protein [Shewanella surugensis]
MLIPASAVNGVSINVFNEFSVSGRKLIIYNGSRETGGSVNGDAAGLIVIESTVLSLADNIEILGAPADLLLVSRGANKTLNCYQCSFENVGRLTLTVAGYNSVSTIQSGGDIGRLTTSYNGVVDINQLLAPGVQSLEVIADRVLTNGIIDLNLTADSHPEGGFIIHPQGSKIVGSGGINIYAGDISIKYADLTVTNVEVSEHSLTVNGQLSAASIAIISSQHITLDPASQLNTSSDLLATSTHNDRFYAPIEGIYIQSIKARSSTVDHGVSLNGRLMSDNIISIKSLDNINQNASIVTGDLRLMSVDDIVQQGYIQASVVEMAARRLINTATIETSTLNVETQYNIHNSFGGDITAKTAVLKSQQGYVVNGSRSQYQSYPLTTQALPISTDLTSFLHGIYYDVQESGTKASKLSAHIRANSLSIDAKAIENINPYSLTRPSSTSWDAGIMINNSQAQQVSIQVENHMALKASQYILNASAIMGLNQAGQFTVNTPKLSNERYRIQLENYIFNQTTLSDDTSVDHDRANVGTTTKVIAYSPPARLYSFGKLLFSNGNDGNDVKEQLINEMSYFEVFADSHFYKTQIQSIGLEITENYDAVTLSNVKDCLRYRTCDGDNISTVAEAETLTAFGGNVYGIDNSLPSQSDLEIGNINGQNAAVKRVVDAYLEPFFYDEVRKVRGEYTKVRGHATSVRIEGDLLKFTVVECEEFIDGGGAKDERCGWFPREQSIPELLGEEAKDREVGDTGYTDTQFVAASIEYVKTLPLQEDVLNARLEAIREPHMSVTFSRFVGHTFDVYSISGTTVNIHFLQTVELFISVSRGRGEADYTDPASVSISIDELMTYLP